jgi:hypothetical protein
MEFRKQDKNGNPIIVKVRTVDDGVEVIPYLEVRGGIFNLFRPKLRTMRAFNGGIWHEFYFMSHVKDWSRHDFEKVADDMVRRYNKRLKKLEKSKQAKERINLL